MKKALLFIGIIMGFSLTAYAAEFSCPAGETVREEIMKSQQTTAALSLARDVVSKIVQPTFDVKAVQFYYIFPLTLVEEPAEDGGVRCLYYQMKEEDFDNKVEVFFSMTLEPKK